MQYFRLQQDSDFQNTPFIPAPVAGIDWRHLLSGKGEHIEDITVFPLHNRFPLDCLDLLDKQFFMISGLLKDVILLYLPKVVWKTVVLIDTLQNQHHDYYLPIFQPVECLSETSVSTTDNSLVKDLVLKEAKIKKQTIFRVAHQKETIIAARLDAAESILRRKPRGVKISRIKTI
ncbi:MAG: hypothetical protein LBR56_03580 [Sporomusaceae bacterium]|nr:hypothetical protein [Sporomusaceae bacterium]